MISDKISAAMITFNAERTLRRSLESIKWIEDIVIVDSGSADNTIAIAKEYTDKIFVRKFDNFSNQKNYAISRASGEWVLSLDADEVVTPELAEEIRDIDEHDVKDGFFIERLNNIYGQFVEYARPDLQLRFFKKDKGVFSQPVHERIRLDRNKTSVLKSKILHYTMDSISHHVRKLDEFTEYDVKFYPVERMGLFWVPKNLILRPFLKFIQHYFFKKAYKDGVLGYIFTINTIMGEFLTQAKYMEGHLKKKK